MNKWTEPYSHDLSKTLIKIFQKLSLVAKHFTNNFILE